MDAILNELRLSAKDSSNPIRFEKAVQRSFEQIGFTAQLLGGSGKTDVLLTAPGAPKYSFSVAVDAKSTTSGSVNDGLVDFDTLKEHKKKHKTDFSAIIGCAFQSERLIKRAVDHNVALISVDALDELIIRHKSAPLNTSSYKTLFEQQGIVDIELLEEARNIVSRSGILMQTIMDCMLRESKDAVTDGMLQERDIYRTLRDNLAFADGIELSEISEMLSFLASPLVGCLGRSKDYFFAIGSLEDAARKFDFFAQSCQESMSTKTQAVT